MEKPSWSFINKTYFNVVNLDYRIFIFSDFEHNWDFFQFLTNENMYYFCLNENINSKYNFDVIYQTFHQKCHHLQKDKICFILFFEQQEMLLKEYPVVLNYVHKKELLEQLQIDKTLIKHFDTHLFDDALKIINNTNKLCSFDVISLCKPTTVIKRTHIQSINNICFFGASVTCQQYSYVNYLQNYYKQSNIIKQGYSGCHINQAIWLVDDVINNSLKPDVCFLEWTTSVLKPSSHDLKCYLTVIVEKLIQHNIIPVFLYLFKTDIQEFLPIINIYEEVASYYNISSLHIYQCFLNHEIDISLFLKDSCHTNYNGSNAYGNLINHCIQTYLINTNINIDIENNVSITSPFYEIDKYKNLQVVALDDLINCSDLEMMIFNNKKYYKICDSLSFVNCNLHLISIHILFNKNNGFIYINNSQIQTWDKNCYYKRYGFIPLSVQCDDNNKLEIKISQECFDTSSCKYESFFPSEKYLWISEFIFI